MNKNAPRTSWRMICHPPQSAEMNMAIDEAIAVAFSEEKVPPTLRLYRWSEPALSIGSFQKWEANWEETLKAAAIPLVRRITGGRALLHDRELTYAVIAGTRDPLFAEGIKGTFYAIAQGLLAGLNRLKVEAEIYAPDRRSPLERPYHPLCFASTSWYEITAGGKKLIGSAQKRWVSHFLQHGSLILEKSRREAISPDLIAENQITLSDLLGGAPEDGALEKAIRRGFEAALPIRLEEGSLTEEERNAADRLGKEKYGNAGWNLRREI